MSVRSLCFKFFRVSQKASAKKPSTRHMGVYSGYLVSNYLLAQLPGYSDVLIHSLQFSPKCFLGNQSTLHAACGKAVYFCRKTVVTGGCTPDQGFGMTHIGAANKTMSKKPRLRNYNSMKIQNSKVMLQA